MAKAKSKPWSEYMWIVSATYLSLGFFNILFAWLGVLCIMIPLLISIFAKNKAYCNKYCGRGQLFALLGKKFGLSRKKDVPLWLKSKKFRYGFLIFFSIMFFNMMFATFLVFNGANSLDEAVRLIWTFDVPWGWAYYATGVSPWVAQFAFGLYGVMLTSSLLGFVTMVLYKPRSWCVYCPMGSGTQLICQLQNKSS